MKKIYSSLFIISSLFFFGCSKDFLKPYEDRIIGTWHITEINKIGIGGNTDNLPFQNGNFEFSRDGSLLYTDGSGNRSNGYWEIEKRNENNEIKRTLHITAVNFNNQDIQSEFYDEMDFRSTNHFVGKVNNAFHTFVTHFKR